MFSVQDRIPGRKEKEIFDIIRKQGVVSKTALLEQCGMTLSSLTRVLEEFIKMRLILEAGRGESTGGRRPILYQINADFAYVFGLDISRFSSQLVLCDMHMRKLDSVIWNMTNHLTPEQFLHGVVQAAEQMMGRRNLNRHRILGIGVGAVGPVDRDAGVILDPLYFPSAGWRDVPVTSYLEQNLRIPARLDNGANSGVIAEYWSAIPEVGNRHEHLLYIRAGVGLRSAMIAGGQVVYGAVDMEGSVGQMIIQTDGIRLRPTDNYGCLESYVSIYALENDAKAKLKQGRRSLIIGLCGGQIESLNFTHLVQALKDNDPLAIEIFTQAATYFGIGLANLLNILHPEKVILGGPLIAENELFFRICTETALNKTYYYPEYNVKFAQERLGEDTLAIGAAVMMMNCLSE